MFSLSRETATPFTRAIRNPKDLIEPFREIMSATLTTQECFVVAVLNARHQVTHAGIISLGSLSASLVLPRDVFREAIRTNGAAIVVAHNHPSGDTNPSGDDLDLTIRLDEAGELLGITLLDHLIITEESHNSLREYGWPGGK